MSSQVPDIFRLSCSIQNYDWGKQGKESLAAQYAKAAVGEDYEVKDDQYYAEIWMGTHQNGPASLFTDRSVSLAGLVASSPRQFLGTKLTTSTFTEPAKFLHSTQVPFLFKILSIAKALPLQAHPDKALGEKLHAEDPKQFVDSNHKPEIAVALKDGFRGFVGFRQPEEIAKSLESVSELREAIADDQAVSQFLKEKTKETLKTLVKKLLTNDQNAVGRCVKLLASHVDSQGAKVVGGDEGLAEVVKNLNAQYPGDVGVLIAPLLVNLVTLNKGESIYIGADEAHAYLEGDIIECMAVSDNVLNAAFVPPDTRNTSTFIDHLTYTARAPSHWKLPRKPYKKSQRGKTIAFDPPLEEFTVLWTQLGAQMTGADAWKEDKREIFAAADGPTIGIVTSGKVEVAATKGKMDKVILEEGAVVFVKPEVEVSIDPLAGEAEVWWATCTD